MENRIAIYWDFENIHASLCSLKFGSSWYRTNRTTKQPRVVDVDSIMEYAAGLGQININRAYANWTSLYNYNFVLQDHCIDLIQLFPKGGYAKNGADIRMAIDITEDLLFHPHISTIAIVGGDSDYVPIAQKVRQKGKAIVGIGVKETTNQYWVKSCSEFKFYASLLMKSASIQDLESEGYEISDLEDAKELLKKAIYRIASLSGEVSVRKAAIKPMMLRLDPSFDETNYGFSSFGSMLEACQDAVEIDRRGKYDHLVSLKDIPTTPEELLSDSSIHPYEKILKKQQIRLPSAENLRLATFAAHQIFAEFGELADYHDFRTRLASELDKHGAQFSNPELSKIKTILYKAFTFQIVPSRSTIRLNQDIGSGADLYLRVLRVLAKRIFDNIDLEEIDLEAVAKLLFGSADKIDDARKLLDEYRAGQSAF